MQVIYKITNLKNGKIYIGKHFNDSPKYLGSGTLIRRAVSKYGKENFKHEVLEYTDEAHVDERERYWIAKLTTLNDYNIAKGGDGGDTLSNHKNIKEIGRKISEKNKGELNGFYGKKHTDEARAKMKKNSYWKGRVGSQKGVKKTIEAREKLSKALTGRKIPAEIRQKMSESSMKAVIAFDLDWIFLQRFASINEAAEIMNLHGSNISRACKSKTHKCGKYKWKYESEINKR